MTLFPNHFHRENLLRMIIITKGKKRKEKESDSEIASSLLWTARTKMGKLWIIIMHNNFPLFPYHWIRAVLHCEIRQVGSKSADNNDWSDSIRTVSINSEFDGGGRGGLRSEDLSEGGVRLNRLTARWDPEKREARKGKKKTLRTILTRFTQHKDKCKLCERHAPGGVCWGL